MPRALPSSTRSIVLVGHDQLQVLDLTGPHEVFALANRLVARDRPDAPPPYALEVRSPDGGPLRCSSGLQVVADRSYGSARSLAARGLDTLIVPGGNGVVEVAEVLVPWIRTVAPAARRVASVCSGSLLLAAAGVLDGRRATSHWTVCGLMARQFPEVEVDPDPIFVRDGNVWTSAGITAGIDLALALVEDDLGADLARDVARYLVMFVQRPGGQAQFSTQLRALPARREPMRDVQAWIDANLADDLSVAALAARAHMSVRHFSRVFREDLGTTPAEYVEQVRVDAARRHLEHDDASVEQIAAACGFGTPETLQRSFRRRVGVTPTAYRRHFHRAPA